MRAVRGLEAHELAVDVQQGTVGLLQANLIGRCSWQSSGRVPGPVHGSCMRTLDTPDCIDCRCCGRSQWAGYPGSSPSHGRDQEPLDHQLHLGGSDGAASSAASNCVEAARVPETRVPSAI